MRPSLLTSLIVVQIVVWCVLGTKVHGWQILCYPAAWMAIATGFLALNHFYDRRHALESARQDVKPESAETPQRSVDHERATASAN